MSVSKVLVFISSFLAGSALLSYANVLGERMRNEINRVRPDHPVSRHEVFMDVFGTWALHKKLFPESPQRTLCLWVAILGYACCAVAILFLTRVF